MKNDMKFTDCINFTFEMKSHTNKGREKEALALLKSNYPYPVQASNIYIAETNEKGNYIVYINEGGFPDKDSSITKKIIFILSLLLFIILTVFLIRIKRQEKQKEIFEQKKIELQNIEKLKQSQEMELKLSKLIDEWIIIENNTYENIYERIELIYSLIGKNCTIENISIENNNFIIDLSVKDSVSILKKFELSNKLTQLKMSRTTVSNSKDLITLAGIFIKPELRIDSNASVAEKIDFYEKLISDYNERNTKLKEQHLSEYIEKIRSKLHECNCNEQYIQIKGERNNLEVELLIYSSAKSILDFIKQIQCESTNMFDIKSFRLRNSDDASRLQTIITFKTGISIQDNYFQDSENIDGFSYSPKEISTALYKAPVIKKTEPKYIAPQKITEKKNEPIKIQKLATYIGVTKKDGITYIMVKTNDMGVIYKLELVTEEINGNCCMDNNYGSYIAKIHNEWYEVKK